MDVTSFEELLQLVAPVITSQETNMRRTKFHPNTAASSTAMLDLSTKLRDTKLENDWLTCRLLNDVNMLNGIFQHSTTHDTFVEQQ